jgi:hypothetical protein
MLLYYTGLGLLSHCQTQNKLHEMLEFLAVNLYQYGKRMMKNMTGKSQRSRRLTKEREYVELLGMKFWDP